MNPFELINAGCYEDNSITRILFGWVIFSYVNDYTCYLYVALSYTENNSRSMSFHDIWVHQANIIRDICKRLIGVEPAPVKQKPRKKIMEKYLGAKWLSKCPQWGPFPFMYKTFNSRVLCKEVLLIFLHYSVVFSGV